MIMRIFRLLAIAAATMANPALLHAKGDNSELNCILDHAAREDIEAVWSAQHEHRTPTAAESAAMDRIAGIAGPCADQYHWFANALRWRSPMLLRASITKTLCVISPRVASRDPSSIGSPRPV
jgi:hypothetical protein